MDRDLFRFDERNYRPRRKTNYFAWTITLLLLTGFAFAAWLGSFYIFGQPERPDSYHILKRLHKIEPPRRFQLTAAPKGEFLNAKQIYDRYSGMRPAELAQANAELVRNYIRNFQQVRGLVPYVVGRYDIMEARELSSNDVFTTGMVALTRAIDRGELLMEHLYPGDPNDLPLMKQTLAVGLEIRLERTHDLSAIIHADRLIDGRLLITAVPLLYGSYTVTRGTATFSLEPPNDLNLAAGWPLFKDPQRRKAEIHYLTYRSRVAPTLSGGIPIAGVTPNPTAGPADNELSRVEPARLAEGAKATPHLNQEPARPAPTAALNGKKIAKNRKTTASPSASPIPSPPQPVLAKATTPTPLPFFSAAPTMTPTPTEPPARPIISATPAIAAASPVATPRPVTVLRALPLTESEENALASTAGGGIWKTFEPGKMPVGRLITPSDLKDVADRGLAGERYYLQGQFVVNFVDANRAVLRPRSKLSDKILHFGGAKSTRIIVEFPAGSSPPAQGDVVSRDETRPYEITEVRQQSDGQLNVFAREIIQP
jgi:hypothetical protein